MAVAAPCCRADSDEGFTSLFDGKTLSGWVIEEGPESAFYVEDGAIVAHAGASSPTWLRSVREYENFDYRGEFLLKGWTDSCIYFHAAEHGRPGWTGFAIKVFHRRDETPTPQSAGAIFPLIPPRIVNVRQGEWNPFRILMDWPRLQVWFNGDVVQDLDVETVPELRYRLRRGYLGFPAVAATARFRNLRIRELASRDVWEPLYESGSDLEKWFVSEGKPQVEALGGVLRLDGSGHLATKAKYRDFELQLYIRAPKAHNGGVLFRSEGRGTRGRSYEIQLHNVEEAHFPTGSLYHYKRAVYPRIDDEKWFLMQLFVKDRFCSVRINGETVLEYDRLENLEEGYIELQAHRPGWWTEYKRIRVKPL
ncbi:MAG: DUF1080 domain-containing protein [Bryobacterales bacterium]|nr:DUF1080 domain-containing protein [Bryobacteraceae bacterium]MDW8356199.1 DUF1080 domain-containing protein [Bryobacterales bacterium]